jgi:hypothetical protein
MGHEVSREHNPRPILVQNETDLAEIGPHNDFIWTRRRIVDGRYARGPFWFARPCPTDPRHGFVESRPVASYSELKQVWAETLEADPNGELLLMPFYPAQWSAILTPASVAVGVGHEGATAGIKSIGFPINPPNIPWATQYLNNQVDEDGEPLPVEERDVAYIEAVSRLGGEVEPAHYSLRGIDVRLVQARSGPPVTGFGNFVPENTLVRRVLKAEGDSLEWEAILKAAGVTRGDGTVVWAPGHTRSSHYAVHAILNGIPIWFDNRPEVGDTLEKVPEPERKWNARQFRRGVSAGLVAPLTDATLRAQAIYPILFALHHATALMYVPHGSYAIGVGCALMIRLGFAAMIGEARHGLFNSERIEDREGNYDLILNEPAQSVALRERIGQAWYLFTECSWPGGGFGGKAWGGCADAVIALDAAVRAALRGRDRKGIRTIEALNVAVNAAHNNGWWMNKFTTKRAFDGMANANPHAVIAGAIVTAKIASRRAIGGPSLIRDFIRAGDIEKVYLDVDVVKGRAVHPEAPQKCETCHHYDCVCCADCEQSPDYCECESTEECELCGHEDVDLCDCPAQGSKAWAHLKVCNDLSLPESFEYDANCKCDECKHYASQMKAWGHPVALVDIMPVNEVDLNKWATWAAHQESPAFPKKDITGVPTLVPPSNADHDDPVLQVCLRPGWRLHFQYGRVEGAGGYKPFDVNGQTWTIDQKKAVYRALVDTLPRTTSLAGSPTQYRVLTKDSIPKLPAFAAEAVWNALNANHITLGD